METQKVYVVYCKDGYGGTTVDKIFSTRELAREYISSCRPLMKGKEDGMIDEIVVDD